MHFSWMKKLTALLLTLALFLPTVSFADRAESVSEQPVNEVVVVLSGADGDEPAQPEFEFELTQVEREDVDEDVPVEEEAPEATEEPAEMPDAAPAFPKKLSLGVKETFQLVAQGDGALTWTSSNAKVAAVSDKGLVTAKKKGSATVKCLSGDRTLGACKITVLAAPSKVTLSTGKLTVNVGQPCKLKAALPKKTASAIEWSSSNAKVVAVDTNGKLTALKAGKAVVTARTFNKKKATCKVTVLSGKVPGKVTLSPKKLSLGVKEKLKLIPTLPEGARAEFTWTSKNPKVAKVAANGTVTGVKAGKTTVTVKTHNGKKASVTVTVAKAPASVTLNHARATLNLGDKLRLKATLPKKTASRLTWTSSDPNVATVDENGAVTALTDGLATVTVKTFNGKKAACQLIIVDRKDIHYAVERLMSLLGFTLEELIERTGLSQRELNELSVEALFALVFTENGASWRLTDSRDSFMLMGWKNPGDQLRVDKTYLGLPVTGIGPSAFEGNTKLKTVITPYATLRVESRAFARTKLEKVYLPATVEFIADDAFEGSDTVEIYAPTDSYAYEYAETHSLVAHEAGGIYRAEQAAETEQLFSELGSEGEEVSLWIEPISEVDLISTDGITDEEALRLLNDYNTLQYKLKQDVEEYNEYVNDALASLTELQDSVADATISMEGVSVPSLGVSFSIEGSGIENLSPDMEVVSVTATENGGMQVQVRDGNGKLYTIVADFDSISVSGNQVRLYPNGTRNACAILTVNGISAEFIDESWFESLIDNLNGLDKKWLTFTLTVESILGKNDNYIKNLTDQIDDLVNLRHTAQIEGDVAKQNEALSKIGPLRTKLQKAIDLRDGLHLKIRRGIAKINPAFTIAGLVDDVKVWRALNKLTNHKHPLGGEASDPAKMEIINNLNTYIKYGKIAAVLDAVTNIGALACDIATIVGLFSTASVAGAPAGIPLMAIATSVRVAIAIVIVGIVSSTTADYNLRKAQMYDAMLHNIRGKVTDKLTGEPLKAVKVSGDGLTVYTDASGQYNISLSEGTHTLTFAKQYYTTEEVTVNSFAAASTPCDVALQPKGFITGTVIDKETRRPISGVSVQYGYYATTTGRDGKYRFNVDAGTDTLTFTKREYATYSTPATCEANRTVIYDAELSAKGILTGWVTDAVTGKYLSGVTVDCGHYRTVTNDNGQYTFEVAAGTGTLKFSKPNYREWSTPVTCVANMSKRYDATLTPIMDDGYYRVILTWGSSPEDLDSHLVINGPNGSYHIYYENMSGGGAYLDVDDTSSYGPETVTFSVDPQASYRYYVHDYTNGDNSASSAMAYSGATVRVYCGNKQVGTYYVPRRSGIYWTVFSINNGEFSANGTVQRNNSLIGDSIRKSPK